MSALEGIQADGVAAYDKAADNYAKVLDQITGDQKESADKQIEQEQELTEAQREELKKREKYLKEKLARGKAGKTIRAGRKQASIPQSPKRP